MTRFFVVTFTTSLRTSKGNIASGRDVKSSRPKWPQGQNFGLGLGLGLKHLASAWPRSAAEEPAAKKKPTYQSVCILHRQTVTAYSYCAVRERIRT